MNVVERIEVANKYYPKKLAAKKLIDIVNLSQGQTLLSLIDRRIDIEMAYSGDPTGEYQRAKNILYNSVKDLHGLRPTFTGILSPTEQTIAKYILSARPKTKNFSTNKVIRNIGAGFIPQLNCDILAYQKSATQVTSAELQGYNDSDPFDQPPYILPGYQKFNSIFQREKEECRKATNLSSILNSRWEESSPHFAYDFISSAQITKGNEILAPKVFSQKNALEQIAELGGDYLTRDILKEWTYNGILAQNIKNGAGNITPEETIDILIDLGRNYLDHTDRINPIDPNHPALPEGAGLAPRLGALPLATILTGIKIITALITALGVTLAVINQMKQNRLFLDQRLDAMGLPSVSPDAIDYLNGNNPVIKTDNASASIALVAAIVAFIFGPKLLK